MTRRDCWPAVLLLAVGCGSDRPPDRTPVHPVRGELHIGGKPADGAYVVFNSPSPPVDGRRPAGLVGPDGSFRPNFYDVGDGAPEGEYSLTVFWPTMPSGMAPDRLNGKYADPTKPVARVTIRPGENVLEPIRLK